MHHRTTIRTKDHADRIMQVVTNLFGNAIRFTLAEAIFEINLSRDADAIVLRVRDSGIGIARNAATYIRTPTRSF